MCVEAKCTDVHVSDACPLHCGEDGGGDDSEADSGDADGSDGNNSEDRDEEDAKMRTKSELADIKEEPLVEFPDTDLKIQYDR